LCFIFVSLPTNILSHRSIEKQCKTYDMPDPPCVPSLSSPRPIQQTAPLLLLPGELRNHIYSFCVEPRLRILRSRSKFNGDYRRASGEYGNLRCVCRQIRKEFAPIYASKTTIRLQQSAVDLCIKAFLPHFTRKAASKIPPGLAREFFTRPADNIQIVFRFGYPFDVTALIHLCQQYHQIRIIFREASASLRLVGELNELFAKILSGTFRPDIVNVFEYITIQCSREPEIAFKLHEGAVFNELEPNGVEVDLAKWLRNMGAPAMESFKLCLLQDSVPPILQDRAV
jgi:hypothetical protein